MVRRHTFNQDSPSLRGLSFVQVQRSAFRVQGFRGLALCVCVNASVRVRVIARKKERLEPSAGEVHHHHLHEWIGAFEEFLGV